MATERLAAEGPPIQYGVDFNKGRLCIGVHSTVLERISDRPGAADFDKLRSHTVAAIQIDRLGDWRKIYLNAAQPKDTRSNLRREARAKDLAHVITTFQMETTDAEKDRILQIGLSGESRDFAMKAGLVVPPIIDLRFVSLMAEQWRRHTTTRLHYEASGQGSLSLIESLSTRPGIWVDDMPWRGLRLSSTTPQEEGGVVLGLESMGLKSHTEQLICVAGLFGAAQNIRDSL